jgi:hypothetical protein
MTDGVCQCYFPIFGIDFCQYASVSFSLVAWYIFLVGQFALYSLIGYNAMMCFSDLPSLMVSAYQLIYIISHSLLFEHSVGSSR